MYSYDEFYESKEPPSPESEGSVQVIGFDGKGVPVIKQEAAKIQARLGKGEKRQKTKEAMYPITGYIQYCDIHARSGVCSLKYARMASTKTG
ncbi:conserved hypothetical protein [delta proteobacterium NaphS2]|nr:conserved hypothetical protein [delta proteobacterium NaphS2]